ncbi:hypothetical protein DERF_001836 [Dermatophagoides farinae]|uniref:Uncharacterized protein n=1 Tax=Dermatophagoides farinae TaxID=6954 RepID=A0A922L9U1_DERFA|nr:hypothetical protein DERF_001836 [Dermatophagoides farinae]
MLISTIHSSHRPMGTTKISQQNVKLIIIHKDHTLTNSADGLFSTFKSPNSRPENRQEPNRIKQSVTDGSEIRSRQLGMFT